MRHLDLVAGPVSRVPDKAAVVMDDVRLTFADVDRRIDAFGAALQARGLVPGDRVALLAGNELEYLEIQGACVRYGFALVPLNVRLAPRELEFIVDDCRPSLLVAGRGLGAVASRVARNTADMPVLGLGDAAGVASYDQEVAAAGTPQAPPTDDSLISTILYTSG